MSPRVPSGARVDLLPLLPLQFIPESARFNVSAGNAAAAAATLGWIARMNKVSLPPGRLVDTVAVRPGAICFPPPNGKAMLEILPPFRRREAAGGSCSVRPSGGRPCFSGTRGESVPEAAKGALTSLHQVCGLLRILRRRSERLGASGEELVVRDGRRARAWAGKAPGGRPLLLRPLCCRRLPHSPHQLPGGACA